MLVSIGLIVAVYAIARLLQVPFEHSGLDYRWAILLLISIAGIVAIALLGMDLLFTGMKTSDQLNLPKL